MSQSEEFGEFEARGRLFTLLYDEAKRAIEGAKSEPAADNRRTAFRVSISAIETLIFWLKSGVLAVEDSEAVFTRAELALLYEEGYRLDGEGSVKTETRFIPLAQNLLFTWKMLLRGTPKTSLHPDVSRSEWRDFKASISIRHRITHPRTLADLDVSPADLETLSRSIDWVFHSTIKIFAVCRVVARRESDCVELESSLTDNAKTFLVQATEILDETLPHENDIIDMNISAEVASILKQLKLITEENGRLTFTRKAAIYMEWRKRKHGQEKSPTNPKE